VETERGIVQQALERDSASIRRQLKDAYINIKCEMMSAVKAQVKKRLQKSHDKTLAMTISMKQEIKDLKLELSVAATGVSYVNAFSAQLIGILPQFMIQ
jgi:isopropylmalate/homocitrate/citramalate synthase